MKDNGRTVCNRTDCQLNTKGVCIPIKAEATVNGKIHRLDLNKCPFYKEKKK